jgi:hypothetical protein
LCNAGPLDDWKWRHPLPQGASILDIAFGNGLFVGVAGAMIVTSPDGTNWISRPLSDGARLRGIDFANGLFVAVGNVLMTSSDGTNWAIQTISRTNTLNEVAFGAGTFVVVGTGGTILTSSDGLAWTDRSTAVSPSLYLTGITFGNGLFVGCANTSPSFSVITSRDGISWSAAPGKAWYPQCVAYGNGTFVVGGSVSATSRTGGGWTELNTSFRGLCFANGEFIGVDDGGVIRKSTNGTQWVNVTSYSAANYRDLYSVSFGNGTYIVGGVAGLLRSSSDGTEWVTHSQSMTDLGALYGVTYAAGQFVVVGYGNESVSPAISWNGSSWNVLRTSSSFTFRDIIYVQGRYLILSDFSIVASSDGLTWISISTGSSTENTALTFGNDTFVLVGKGGSISTSTNALEWNQRASGRTDNLYDVTYGNGRFVAVGDGIILSSEDLVNWVSRTTSGNLRAVTYRDGVFVAAGLAGLIRTSTNALDWTTRPPMTTNNLRAIAWGHGVFLVVGDKGTILSSPDGITWSSHLPSSAVLIGSGSGTGVFTDFYTAAAGPDSFMIAGTSGCVFESGNARPRVEAVGPDVTGFRFLLSGLAGARYRIECSTNLESWEDIGLITNGTPSSLTQDSNATNLARRFYRVLTR